MKRSNYIVQVPRKHPDDVIEDDRNRLWIKASAIPATETTWENDEDYWYVWFSGADCPEDGEIISIGSNEYTVESVFRLYNYKRAVVIFS